MRESPSARAMVAVLKAARIERGLSIDDVAYRSGVPREVCAEIENLAHMIDLGELSALAPAVGMTAVEVLVVGETAAAASE